MPTGPLRDLGPCEVWFGPMGSEVKVGETHGGVQFRHSTQSAPVHEDGKGVTPVDKLGIGIGECSVIAPFTRLGLAKLATVIPGTTHSSGSGGNDDILVAEAPVGESAADSAQSLILKPIVDDSVSTTSQEWMHLPKAFPDMATIELGYDTENQRVFSVTFNAFPKTGTLGGVTRNIFWHIGDDAQITWS